MIKLQKHKKIYRARAISVFSVYFTVYSKKDPPKTLSCCFCNKISRDILLVFSRMVSSSPNFQEQIFYVSLNIDLAQNDS